MLVVVSVKKRTIPSQNPSISDHLHVAPKPRDGSLSKFHNYCRKKTTMIQGKATVARPATVAALVAAAAANGEKPKALKGTLWLDTIVKQISISFPVTKLAAGGRACLGRIIPVEERQRTRGRLAVASLAVSRPVASSAADGCYIPTNCAPNTSTVTTVSTSCTRPAVALVPAFAYSFTWHADIVGNKLTIPRLHGSTDGARTTVQWTLTSLVPLRTKPFCVEAPTGDLKRRLLSITNQLHARIIVSAPHRLPMQKKTDPKLASKKSNLENIISNLHSCMHSARVTESTPEREPHVLVHLDGVTNRVKIIEQILVSQEVAGGSSSSSCSSSSTSSSRSSETSADLPQLLKASTEWDEFRKLRLRDKTLWVDGNDYPIVCSQRSQKRKSPTDDPCSTSRNNSKLRRRSLPKTEPPTDVVRTSPRKRRLSEPDTDTDPKVLPKRNAFSDPEENMCTEINVNHKPSVTETETVPQNSKDSQCGSETENSGHPTEKTDVQGGLANKSRRMVKRVLKDDFIYF